MAIIPFMRCQSGVFKKEDTRGKEEKKRAIASACKAIAHLAEKNPHPIPEIALTYKYCIRTAPKIEGARWEIGIHTTIDVSNLDDMAMASSSDQEIEAMISIKRGEKQEVYWVGGTTAAKIIDAVTEKIRPRVNGNRYSIDNLYPISRHLPSDYWNADKYKRDHKLTYQRYIYPLVLESVESLLKENNTVLELCAGDGEIAETLLGRNAEKIHSYHLVELNETCCTAMGEKFAAQPKAKVHKKDIIEMNYGELGDEPFDLVIGSGALTHQVLPSREGALTALTKASQKMREGGHLILCGVAPLWIRHEDFAEKGLKVLNSGIPYQRWIGDPYLPFIIAQKI